MAARPQRHPLIDVDPAEDPPASDDGEGKLSCGGSPVHGHPRDLRKTRDSPKPEPFIVRLLIVLWMLHSACPSRPGLDFDWVLPPV
jgi:hypothetical protein